MPATTGKRYVCPKTGAEVIVTRGGDGSIYSLLPNGEKVELVQK